MRCPTVLGRVQTRVVTMAAPAVLALVLSAVAGDEGFVVTLGLWLVLGVALDVTVYPWLIRRQPPLVTGLLGIGELLVLLGLVAVLRPGRPGFADGAAVPLIAWYAASWLLAALTRVVVLPVALLTWSERGGELGDGGWSMPAEREPLPLVAAVSQDAAGSRLVRALAGEAELERHPALSPRPVPARDG
jgi:hypothetical protein